MWSREGFSQMEGRLTCQSATGRRRDAGGRSSSTKTLWVHLPQESDGSSLTGKKAGFRQLGHGSGGGFWKSSFAWLFFLGKGGDL